MGGGDVCLKNPAKIVRIVAAFFGQSMNPCSQPPPTPGWALVPARRGLVHATVPLRWPVGHYRAPAAGYDVTCLSGAEPLSARAPNLNMFRQ